MIKIEQHIPSILLKPFVKAYMFIECEHEVENAILPDTSIVMAIRYGGMVSLKENDRDGDIPTVALSGIRKSSRIVHYSEQAANLLIIFEPMGAAAFFYEPMNELFGQSVPLDCFKNYRHAEELKEKLALAKCNVERIRIIEQFLLSKLILQKPDLQTLSAIEKIKSADGNIAISQLAKELYISQDAFEKKFRRLTGSSPKQFSRIVRLRNAINKHSSEKALTDTALDAGYYDQAHFIKDFKTFTGQNPQQFFSEGMYW
ncbi:MAG TPA: helix-turn-helix domain-containing protein [Flavipsychrobacter sp.]|nr:helix-turn-helix domain-containing protein [Flavipsychrobacter sp.]